MVTLLVKRKANMDVQTKVKAYSTHIGVVSCGRMWLLLSRGVAKGEPKH